MDYSPTNGEKSMSDKNLREKLIRLAHENPELREHVLPLLKEASVSYLEVETINDLTDRNDHTGAALLLCEVLGLKRQAKVLHHIKEIHSTLRHMPSSLSDFQYDIMKPVYNVAKKTKLEDGTSLYDALK